MKRTITRILTALALISAVACSHQKNHEHADDGNGEAWPEMDAFHMTMAEAYHPFKDSADLKPAKNLAENLANESETWAGSKRPEKANTEEVENLLAQFRTGCRAFADHVKASASDAELGKELTALHQQFHELMEKIHGEKR